MMRRGKVVVAWILATAWLCIEVAFHAANRVLDMPSETAVALAADHLQQAVWAVGPRFAALFAAGIALWFIQGILGAALTIWAAVEAGAFIRDHARRQREALAAAGGSE
ncbi:MAG: hypothetical protein ACYC2H_10170 [Thermoplasmatota archaeon]